MVTAKSLPMNCAPEATASSRVDRKRRTPAPAILAPSNRAETGTAALAPKPGSADLSVLKHGPNTLRATAIVVVDRKRKDRAMTAPRAGAIRNHRATDRVPKAPALRRRTRTDGRPSRSSTITIITAPALRMDSGLHKAHRRRNRRRSATVRSLGKNIGSRPSNAACRGGMRWPRK